RAAIDLRSLDQTHQNATETAQQLFSRQVIPAQIKALGEQVTTTKSGTPRKMLTKAHMASLQAPVLGADELGDHLTAAARTGATAAMAEMSAQGVTVQDVTDGDLAARVADQAQAVAQMAAQGLSLAAQR